MSFPLYVLSGSLIAAATVAAAISVARQRWLAVVVAIAGAAVLLLVHGRAYFDFYADDALITLRYSQHLADGLGPNWNSSGRVEGYTSFLWMGVHAGLGKLGLDLVDASRALGFLSVLATTYFSYRIWDLWSRDEPDGPVASPLVLVVALLALALTDGVAFWGFSGMETAAFMALLTLSAYLFLRERRAGGLPWSAAALAATAMTRPEGLIAVAVSGFFLLIQASSAPDQRRAAVRVASWAGVFVAFYGSYFIWRYSYYDELLPNTFYAKVETTSALYDRGLDYVWTYGLRYQLIPLFAGMALLAAKPKLRSDALYLLAFSGAMLAGVVVEGGDDFPHGRMIVPLMPVVYIAGLAGLASLLDRLSLRPVQTAALVSLVLVLGAMSLFRGSLDLAAPVQLEERALKERQLLGTWLSENTPPDYTIAAFAVGAIGYYSERDILDLLGLNDVVIAHTEVPDFGAGLAGHEKYNIDYVLDDVRPEIIVTNDAMPGPLTTEEFRSLAAVPSPVRARNALFDDLRLWQLYEVRSVEVEGRWFNFLQRKDTLSGFLGRPP